MLLEPCDTPINPAGSADAEKFRGKVLGGEREHDSHRCAPPWLAFHGYPSLKLPDGQRNGAESQPGAVRLGREERVEETILHLGGHAATGIRDSHARVRARTHFLDRRGAGVSDRGLDGQHAAIRHCVVRVQQQVQQDTFEGTRSREDSERLRPAIESQTDRVVFDMRQRRGRPADHLVQIGERACRRLRPRHRSEALRSAAPPALPSAADR